MADTTSTSSTAKTATKKPAAARKPAAAKKPTTATKPAAAAKPRTFASAEPKARFGRALEEARAGVQALGKDLQDRTGAYREKMTGTGADWADEAKNLSGQARDRAASLATDGKAKASDAISGLGKIIADNAGALDDRLGSKYGDYARTAARTMKETAAKLDAKDLNDLGDDARDMIKKSPGLAIGIAAVAGFLLARMAGGGGSDE